ncbi:MAG: hypothetical protein GX585_00980, partial [Clostridiales bacterium]|nr:hypothetical protein [Clostridiales bacterium]
MRGIRLIGLVLTLCCISGCSVLSSLPSTREMEDTSLVRVMGVDVGKDRLEGTILTAAVPMVEGQKGEEGREDLILHGVGETLAGATMSMVGQGTAVLAYSHVGQMVLGQALAERSVGDVLDYALWDRAVGMDTALWVVKDSTAEEAIHQAKQVSKRMKALELDAGLSDAPMTQLVRGLAEDLAENKASFLPALRVEGEDLLAAGYGIIKEDALVGYAEGLAAEGITLLKGEVVSRMLEVTAPGAAVSALRLTSVSSKIKPVFDGGRLTGLDVQCQVQATIAQGRGEMSREEAGELLKEAVGNRVGEAIALAQALDADYLGLRSKTGVGAPWHWEAVNAQWEEA